MAEQTKMYESFEDMLNAGQIMHKFQTIHNVLRKDYMELLRLTEEHRASKVSFDALYRASLRSLFSLIEADISGLNALDGYPGYDDRKHQLIPKFKKTFKQIAKTWNKEAIQQQYFSAKISALLLLKTKRDELVHPKEHVHLHEASPEDFTQLKKVFEDYDSFINELMNGFFIGTKIKVDWGNRG
ncbi:hypothetical protein ACFS5N_05845 [Mucilaginibacter ximonensis]|uniref:HEPN AbiU2-like domain-containing protein n=1 Tax=Mucilaginibacter ximonensis TaxID=538021 RepID=A0ABW5YB10_9SPHI